MAINFERNKELAPLTTFGVPARAAYYAEYSSRRELEKITRSPIFLENEVLHIGEGSNLLFLGDYKGLVLRSTIMGKEIYEGHDRHTFLIAGAGEKWSDLVDFAVANGLAGLENLAGIPGSVGASAVQNVGAYGREAGDLIFAVECFDTLKREPVRFTAEECRFGYRDSMFKHEGRGRYVVMRVSYLLKKSELAECLDYGPLRQLEQRLGHTPTIAEVAAEVVAVRNAKLPDPAFIGSAGSFFKNPVIDTYYYREEVMPRTEGMRVFEVGERRVKLPAAWLIDHAGLKGERVGGAQVWEKQPLVLANTGNATGRDVIALAKAVCDRVQEMFGVDLRPEVNIIDPEIHIRVLGSGTSKGIPEIGCTCRVCKSSDTRDKRMRSSVLVNVSGMNILIDPSPDFRMQALNNDIRHVDAVLITHSHYDHVGGIDDLRPLCANGDIPFYVRKDVDSDLRRRLDYCFREHLYPGVPKFDMHIIGTDPFLVNGVKIIPVEVFHGKLPILGFRIGNFGYITDAKTIEPEEREKLRGLKVLIVNALRKNEHFAHFSLQEALNLIAEVRPERAYLTHFNHQIGTHAELSCQLPAGVFPAYDGLEITC